MYENDLLGNRTWRNYGTSGVQRCVYDVLNRCTSACGATGGARYEYRADGMRVEKVSGLSVTWNPADKEHASGWYDENWIINKETTRYSYDGQMCFEEDRVAVQYDIVYRTRYGLGPRGIDWIETSVTGSQQNQQYPLYDGHGNMIATISLSGTLSNLREYDVWGGVRDQASVTTDPNTRYCANLGHKQDDESGLIYMRARFYDAGTGRFISEDPAMDGTNWFVYCNNDPANHVDATGKFIGNALIGLLKFIMGHMLLDRIDEIVNRMQNLTRYMAQLDELIAAASTADDWAGQMLVHRKEMIALEKELKQLQRYEKIRRYGSGVGTAIAKLLGYCLIVSALIDDIDLGPEGLGSLDAIYGQ